MFVSRGPGAGEDAFTWRHARLLYPRERIKVGCRVRTGFLHPPAPCGLRIGMPGSSGPPGAGAHEQTTDSSTLGSKRAQCVRHPPGSILRPAGSSGPGLASVATLPDARQLLRPAPV